MDGACGWLREHDDAGVAAPAAYERQSLTCVLPGSVARQRRIFIQPLPSLHSYKHLVPPAGEVVVVSTLCWCALAAVSLVLGSARVKPAMSAWIGAAAAAGLSTAWAVLLEPDPECIACSVNFHYGTPDWSDTTVAALAVGVQVVWVAYVTLVNLALKQARVEPSTGETELAGDRVKTE